MTLFVSVDHFPKKKRLFILGNGPLANRVAQLATNAPDVDFGGRIKQPKLQPLPSKPSRWYTRLLKKPRETINHAAERTMKRYLSNRTEHDFILVCSPFFDQTAAILKSLGITNFANTYPIQHLYNYNPDVHVRRFIERFAPSGSLALDIGANIGVFSCLLAQRYETVIAFEPGSRVRQMLAANVPENVTIQPFALSDKPSTAEFHIDEGSEASSSSSLKPGAFGYHGKKETIEVTTVDLYCSSRNLAPAFLKIDAEGVDLAVLRGAETTIREARPAFVFEFTPQPDSPHFEPYEEVLVKLNETHRLFCLEDYRDAMEVYVREKNLPELFLDERGANIGAVPR